MSFKVRVWNIPDVRLIVLEKTSQFTRLLSHNEHVLGKRKVTVDLGEHYFGTMVGSAAILSQEHE